MRRMIIGGLVLSLLGFMILITGVFLNKRLTVFYRNIPPPSVKIMEPSNARGSVSLPTLSVQFSIVDSREQNSEVIDCEEFIPEDGTMVAETTAYKWVRKPLLYTFLLFGFDNGNNTDVIFVMSYDVPHKTIDIVSVARDTMVDVTRSVKKINAAYATGKVRGGHDGGVSQLKTEITTLIGFVPDFYISIDMNAFIKVIDALGGIEIDVPFRMKYDDPAQNLHIDLQAGTQTLNGNKAVLFARYRMGNEGYRSISTQLRATHQQMILMAIKEKIFSPAVISNVPELVKTYIENVKTDLELWEILWFVEQALSGDLTINNHQLPVTGQRSTLWYDMLNCDEAKDLVNRTINPFTRNLE